MKKKVLGVLALAAIGTGIVIAVKKALTSDSLCDGDCDNCDFGCDCDDYEDENEKDFDDFEVENAENDEEPAESKDESKETSEKVVEIPVESEDDAPKAE